MGNLDAKETAEQGPFFSSLVFSDLFRQRQPSMHSLRLLQVSTKGR